MKKIVYLVLLAVLLFSCKKEPVVVPQTYTITFSQLTGNWNTVEYQYENTTLFNDSIHTTACDDANNDSVTHGKGMIFIRLVNVDILKSNCDIGDCSSLNSYMIELLPNKINFTLSNTNGVDFSFDIISYNNSTLVLKLSSSAYPQYLVGAVYILKRPVDPYINSTYNGRWINDYTLVKGAKDTTAERYQYQFMDNGNVLETSTNDTTIHIKYDFWWFANDNCIVFSNTTAMERFTIIQAPTDNHMILQPYKTNYQYLLTKVK